MDTALAKSGEICGLGLRLVVLCVCSRGYVEANRLKTSIGALSVGNLVSVVGILMLVLSIYRQVSAVLEDQKRQRLEYQRMDMDAQILRL